MLAVVEVVLIQLVVEQAAQVEVEMVVDLVALQVDLQTLAAVLVEEALQALLVDLVVLVL